MNRFTANHYMWLGRLNELTRKHNDNALIPHIAKEIMESKDIIPPEVQERIGLTRYKTEEEIRTSMEFGEISLKIANTCIFNTRVYETVNGVVYEAEVDNIPIFPALIFADFIVNVSYLLERESSPLIKIYCNHYEALEHLMRNVFPKYCPGARVEFFPARSSE